MVEMLLYGCDRCRTLNEVKKGAKAELVKPKLGSARLDNTPTHYSSTHQILLVGEGDFSLSLSLALSFGSAFNICTSSLDSYVIVVNEYKKAKSNLRTLEMLGAYILHGVDATKMKLHPHLRMRKFDQIIFNFPHAGYHERNIICI
ncbi:heavy metal-associated isoprenylated plant protein 41-like [Pistacia vera]|uniref:heavy metal-associated isoprenylated plant protein 41-like n=1 Tax=Pistacia vera TaxID=55513 RepID=UPI0012638638|nr:heavy metal-associated isoprenylated plant protein 41-like [Pistacia vera]